jgi:hypothetical protein
MLQLPCMLVCPFVCANRTRDRGCSKHPVFPAPSNRREGKRRCKPRATSAARSRNYINVIASAKRSNPVSTCGAMDCFAALAMTWREQASLVPHLEKAATRPPKREPPPARRTRLPTKQAGNPSGQNVAFCDAAKATTWPLLTGNGNPVRFSVLVRLVCKLRSRLVALCKNNGEESCAN